MAGAFRQLALDLALGPRLGADDFLVAEANRVAFDAVSAWPRWPDTVLLVIGPEGAGKTHLGTMWAERAAATTLAANDLRHADPRDVLGSGAALVEDADRIGEAEATLFHLLNLARENRSFLLLTARLWPDQWRLATPDLLSRLRLAPAVLIEPPDDATIRAVLVKHFADRQLVVEAGVVDFVAQRIERSLGAVRAFVATVDRESLAQHRRLTKPMAGDILRSIGEPPD